MITWGSASAIAIIAFVLGKIWSSSEAIFKQRQAAYAHFLRHCLHSSEVAAMLIDYDEQDFKKVYSDLKLAHAEFQLYASEEANEIAGRYLGLVAGAIGGRISTGKDILDFDNRADQTFQELCTQMRKDALGFTYFGIKERMKAHSKQSLDGD